MQQTIYGETPKFKKTRVFERSTIDSFLEKTLVDFKKLKESKNCLYTNNSTLIDDPVANYLNILSEKNQNRQLKFLIGKEYNKLENMYPKLGSIFVEYYFNKKINLEGEKYIFHQDNKNEIIDSLNIREVKDIANFLFENCSLEHNITIENVLNDKLTAVKTENINFRIKYDSEFLGRKNKHTIKNFRYAIIDGVIQSIGEIYHVLYKSAETKEPYVILCFGISPEVKDVIIQNNAKGNTEIMPVCFNFEEDTINILNDIAVLMNTDIITAKLGQTISQEVSRDLPIGKKIEFDRTGFILTPNINKEKISKHRKFLEKRAKETSNDKNKHLLIERLRRMSSKSLILYIPENLLKDNSFVRELDYFLRFLSNSSKKMIKIKSINSNNTYFLPENSIEIIKNSSKSLEKIFDKLDKMILYEES